MFTFESLQSLKPRAPAGLLLAAALVVLLETGLRAVPDKYLFPYYSRLGFSAFMENEVLPKFAQPQILILGTSRAADAIMPRMVDDALGLPANSTVNLSIFGSRTSDWEALYRRNRAKFSKLKLCVVVLDEWSFSSGTGTDEHFCLTAPLEDRLNFVQPVETPIPPNESDADRQKREAAKLDNLRAKRNRLLADWVFQSRLKIEFVPLAIAGALHLGGKRTPIFDANNMIRSTQADSGVEFDHAESYDSRIHNFYNFFDTHPIYLRHIEDLARRVHEDGGRMLLIQLPNRRLYQDEVDKLFPAAYQQHLRVSAALAQRIDAPFEAIKYPREIGLSDADYVDYCHLAWAGTMRCTQWFADLVRKDKLLEAR